MTKIICFIDSLVAGGAQRQLVGLAKLLNENNYDVLVLTYNDLPFYKNYLINNNVKYICLKNAHNPFKRIPICFNFFKKWQPDIIISYLDTPSIINCITRLLGAKHKVIVSERNTTQNVTLKEKVKFCLYRISDTIIPNSHSQEIFIRDNYPKLIKKTRTITNFVDTNIFCPKDKVSQTNKGTSILVVGRIMPQKNVLNFIDAVKILVDEKYDVQINWFGYKDQEYYKLCIDKIKDYNLDNIFHIHDASNNILVEYQNADVFCLPSIYEGFPNVICEAMSCGLPILASNICDNPRIVHDKENGFLFNPLNINDIYAKVSSFIKLENKNKDLMGRKSRELAIEHFSDQSFIKKYINIINEI